jgi:pimeloyl-[acyl-carrier protein] methyl ester esterase
MKVHIESVGQGPDLVLLHGWGLHGGVFARLAHALADDYCLHLVDLPGHGASAPIAGFDGAEVARLLAGYFPLPVHVLGWSLGGLIAQHWAIAHPQQVKSLALVASSPCFVRRPDWPHAQQQAAIAAVGASLESDFDATLERFLALQTLGSATARTTLKALREQLFSHGRPQGLQSALQLLLDADLRQEISAISCPVGLFFGERDVITPLAAGQWLAEQLADATLYAYPQASHAPFLSHEAAFIAGLKHHLDNNA